jgi:peptide chain release factor subunit 1
VIGSTAGLELKNKGKNMISRDDLRELLDRAENPRGPILSVYLDTDQSREVNIERGFETVLKDMLREIKQKLDKDKQKVFMEDAERVRKFVEEEYRDPRRSLIIFSDVSDNFFRVYELNVNVRNGPWWNETPYVRPLLELLDEYERHGVVLTDRQHARLFTVYLGEIEEHREAFAIADVRHVHSAGMDHLLSQMNIERKADVHAHWHLKKLADLMSHLASVHEFDWLILAGTVEATSHLYSLLPPKLRDRVVRQITLDVDANKATVLEEALRIEVEVERERETRLVEQLMTAAAKHQKAVMKLSATLRALQEWRISELVYTEGFTTPGGQCTNCKALFAGEKESCDYCGREVRQVDDLIDRADTRVVEMDGKVEQVRGDAAARLGQEGGIGAFLSW